jgi:soluble lytic murein transglycosylase-like protein
MKRAITLPVICAFTCILAAGCGSPIQQRRSDETRPAPLTHAPAAARASSAPTTHAGHKNDRSATSLRCEELLPMIREVADKTGLEAALLVGIVRVESNFRNDVRSPVGAIGLTQCMPATARAKKCGPLDDPHENLMCGARVIKAFLKYYKNSIYLGLSGYNAGHGMPGRAKKTAELPQNVDYVEKVLQAASRFEARGCDF